MISLVTRLIKKFILLVVVKSTDLIYARSKKVITAKTAKIDTF